MKNTPWWADTSGASSDRINRVTASISRWPCRRPVKRARLVLSQSCSAFFCVVSFRLRIISLMLSFRSDTSPRASTWIDRDKSPRVTAVATSAIARTWVVRLAASWLTFSVKSFQVPEAPGTLAWPPSFPSTPTSRATEVTWSANTARVSVISLMVLASDAISPWAATVSFFFMSPFATAVTTPAIPRTWAVKFAAMKLTFSVKSFQVPPTPFTCAWPPSFPSVPTSRATRVTSDAKEDSWSTITLMVSLSCRISPWASAAIFFERSPFATAVVTSAMLRTWPVRLPAIELTLSVKSFQVPATPGTLAWPPSFPSVPTSRATRVTSDAKEDSWSTITLIVSFSCRISPWASAAIFLERSPFATAVVTSAMLRTWPVKLPAIEFTESVKSFQVPATPGTLAWPPSFPSVPTSRATRVTSDANEDNWSTITLMVSFSSRISPRASAVIFLDRLPFATAVVTSAMLRTWRVRLPAIELTFSVKSFQVPPTPFTWAWPPSLPSVPTSRATRVTSDANEDNWSTITLMVFFSSRISPLASAVIFLPRSPFATAVVTSAMLRTWPVRLPAIEFTESVKSFQVPPTPFTWAWPPSLPSVPTSRATRVTSDAKERSWSTMVLMVSFNCRISPRTSTVIFLERSPFATAVVTSAMLRTWEVRLPAIEFTESVKSFQVPATPGTLAWPPSLPSVPTSRATRVTSEANEDSWSTMVLAVVAADRNWPRRGRPSTSSAIFCDRSPFATEPITRAISVVGRTRSSIRALTELMMVPQPPATEGGVARWVRRPSWPTTRLTLTISWAILSLLSMMSLRVSAILPFIPVKSEGRRTEKSPFLNATSAASSSFASSTSGTSTISIMTQLLQ